MTLRVGLLGFGAIGRGIATAVASGKAGDTEIVAILVRDPAKADAAPELRERITARFETFLTARPDIVVEVAGQAALRQHAEAMLSAGLDLMVLSIGAFTDASFADRVGAAARRHGRRVRVPSGAIVGLDAIGSAALADVDEVTHTIRKNPRAFTKEQLGGDPPTGEARLLYEGPARAGVASFPENANVAAAVSLAGIGLDRTRLRVYADPAVERNVHEVRLRGYVGELDLVIRNTPTENPKTGRIVALSVAKALRDLAAPIVIGA